MSTADPFIAVKVAYASADWQLVRLVRLAQGGTVEDAIDASGILALLPEGLPDHFSVGIYSRKVVKEHIPVDGDRIEIYRPLASEPMEARRRRAQGD